MASNLVEIVKTDLYLLVCLKCNSNYDRSKLLPCNCFICPSCVGMTETVCPICQKDIVAKDCTLGNNKLVEELLCRSSPALKKDEPEIETRKAIDEASGIISEKLSKCINDSESIIKDYCSLLKDKIDIKTESILKSVNDHRDSLLNKIDEYEKTCLENSKTSCLTCTHEMPVVKEQMTLYEAILLKRALNEKYRALEKHLFSAEHLKFFESEFKIEECLIGYLTCVRSDSTDLIEKIKSLEEYQMVKSVDYKTAENTRLLYLTNDKFVVLIKPGEFGIRKSFDVVIKLFSFDGVLLKQISQELEMHYTYHAVTLRHRLVVAYENDTVVIKSKRYKLFELKVYDCNLNLIKSLTIDYDVIELYASESEIYAVAMKENRSYLLSFDDSLDLKDIRMLKKDDVFIKNPNLDTGRCFDYKQYQIQILESKVYAYFNKAVEIYDLSSLSLLETVDLNKQFLTTSERACHLRAAPREEKYLFRMISSETFILFGARGRILSIYNTQKERLFKLKLNSASFTWQSVASFFITQNGDLAINDSTQATLYFIQQMKRNV